MVSPSQTSTDSPSDAASDAAPEAAGAAVGTPIAVWILYVLGIVAAAVMVASIAFVAIAYFASGDGTFYLDVSVPSLVVWVGLVVAAVATWLWRRFEA